jgi:hypothetical protein
LSGDEKEEEGEEEEEEEEDEEDWWLLDQVATSSHLVKTGSGVKTGLICSVCCKKPAFGLIFRGEGHSPPPTLNAYMRVNIMLYAFHTMYSIPWNKVGPADLN